MLNMEHSPLGHDALYRCGKEVEMVVRVDTQVCWVCAWGASLGADYPGALVCCCFLGAPKGML